ncbi:MAG TPA: NUDIX hydrolase [Phycisphaerae bacterium]|mgnify:CR=1 FL=1|nr:NUDIX hydrolase [Phycisphaerae bacterium]
MKQGDGKEIIAAGKYMNFARRGRWEFVERKNLSGIVAIVAVNARDELILVEQFRAPTNCRVVELPAGLVGDEAALHGESLETAARRELEEETGYTAERFEYLFEGAASSGIIDEIIAFYRALEPRKIGAGGGDDSEDIVVHEVPLADVHAWLADRRAAGAATDIKIYAALAFLK